MNLQVTSLAPQTVEDILDKLICMSSTKEFTHQKLFVEVSSFLVDLIRDDDTRHTRGGEALRRQSAEGSVCVSFNFCGPRRSLVNWGLWNRVVVMLKVNASTIF